MVKSPVFLYHVYTVHSITCTYMLQDIYLEEIWRESLPEYSALGRAGTVTESDD